MTQIDPNDRTVLTAGRASTLLPQIVAGLPPFLRLSDADGVAAYYEFPGSVVSATAANTVGDLQFIPFWSGAGGALSEIAFNITVAGGAGAKARCGLYNADQNTLKPTSLIVDGGEFDATITGLKNTTVTVSLQPDTLYFTAFICGTAAPTCTSYSSGMHIFGRSATFAAQFGWIKTGFGYGALPAVAPSPVVFMTSTPIMVCARWSAYNR